jgi:L-cysteine:1D-myo-inositol 2-amino-2-deoxy-alpha-D-glucopyranoside ligase
VEITSTNSQAINDFQPLEETMLPIALYNSLTHRIESFKPAGQTVTIYVCGITPYDTTHLGHAFTYTAADILIRFLEFQGHKVLYVQNVTDIDDDILRKACEVNEDWREVGNRWTVHFIKDMQTLNVRPPDHFPRATDVIPEIIAMVQRLIEVGVAYEADSNVYFDVASWPGYGKLSRLAKEQMLPIANERGNDPDDPYKRDPLDFVLWQACAPNEPAWESPWGPGRPGWHIECSAMATQFLGETVDIHSGGSDLIFPHHESEIAQVEPMTRQPFVRYWLHMGMVHHEGQKMSKSLGNLVMVRDLLSTWSPDALRLYLGSHHYRQVWSHDPERLAQAAQLAEKLRRAVTAAGGPKTALNSEAHQAAFVEAMSYDLDTFNAILIMNDLADEILAVDRNGPQVQTAQETLRSMGRVFGLRLEMEEAETRVTTGWNKHLQRFDEK